MHCTRIFSVARPPAETSKTIMMMMMIIINIICRSKRVPSVFDTYNIIMSTTDGPPPPSSKNNEPTVTCTPDASTSLGCTCKRVRYNLQYNYIFNT